MKDSPNGEAPDPKELVLTRDKLPLLVTFGDRRYVIIGTRGGGLVMNGR